MSWESILNFDLGTAIRAVKFVNIDPILIGAKSKFIFFWINNRRMYISWFSVIN
jgi:hypothetical protein